MAEMVVKESKGKKGKGGKKAKKMSTRVDLTPMVDLGFLLVTFFMLTTTFSKPQTMEINMPIKDDTVKEEEKQAVKATHAMSIIADENNLVYVYMGIDDPNPIKTDYSANGIRKILYEKVREVDNLTVLIKPTDKSTYKNVVDLLDEMNITKVKRYALVPVEPHDMDIIKKLL
ncbi:MAG: biopolymer transporter ExbD [Bacteroidota bacterium]|nr:biopolymer transporter ExbD [Bacteroidota bacterium]